MRPVLLALLFAVVATPFVASAEESEALCIIFIRPSADFREVRIDADLILTPEQRTNLSARVDADADGNITPTEVGAFENASRTSFDAATVATERALRLDGREMLSLDVSTKLRNWTGARTDAEKGVVTELRTYRFDTAEGPVHDLEGALYVRPVPTQEPQVVIEVVVIEAPRDWVIARITQVDDNGTMTNESLHETRSVRLSGFDLSHGSVTFRNASLQPTPVPSTQPSPPDARPTPTPASSALVVTTALALAALVASAVRRRRQG